MTRQDAIYYLMSELSDYGLLWQQLHPELNVDIEGAQQRDREALLALGVTDEEMTEAQ